MSWLGEWVEEVGVEVYLGFVVFEVFYYLDGFVKGVVMNDFGIVRDGRFKDIFECGMEFYVCVIMFGEGCYGSLSK